MKKAFKIIIPIFLALIIIVSTVWYLFRYDPGFTQDLLLYSARGFEKEGNHNIAQWFYNLAYKQADDNDSVAIELAYQYRKEGNYTKAEFTLYNAIMDGGGIDLYTELSKLYVEQDKLLDAINLIQNTTGAIREQLDAMRPAEPAASLPTGLINERTSVELTADDGRSYVTKETVECPSVATDLYSGPIELTDGTNRLYAITVGNNGLVSQVKSFEYIVGGIIEEAIFTNGQMEAYIRELLDTQEPIYTDTLWDITSLQIPKNITNYTDLKLFPYLESLTIENGNPDALAILSDCVSLKELIIRNTVVSDEIVGKIAQLPRLEKLSMTRCKLSTISNLAGLKGLTFLDLSYNTIRDISVIGEMASLQELHISNNAVNDISVLSGCTKLLTLNASYNSISDISRLYSISTLSFVNISHNVVSSIDGIAKLSNLKVFDASNNKLNSVSALADCVLLTELILSNNQIQDISALHTLNNLTILNFAHNQVSELPAWSKDCKLVTIDGSYNLLSSLEPLSGLEYLNNVLMDSNTEIESIDCLVNCHALIKVNIFKTKVIDVSLLNGIDPDTGLSYGIIVNYDPTQAILDKEKEEAEATEPTE